MSRALDVLQMKEEDVLKFLNNRAHLGVTNLDFQMEQYIYKRKSDGIYVINLKRTQEKLLLAAQDLAGVSVTSSKNTCQRAVLKSTAATGATTSAGSFTLGTFTNQTQAVFWEPHLLVVIDPKADHQPLMKVSYVLPTDILCNRFSSYVDVTIPCHTRKLTQWMLAGEVLRMHGTISCEYPWEVMPDLSFYRDPKVIEKEAQGATEKALTQEDQGEWAAPTPEFTAAQPQITQLSSVPIQQFPTEDWSAQLTTEWCKAPTAERVGTATE
uniref:40S ribosomal protein SA n=1 Tax=Otolemur garnettii TaxID=30611 RepID=H0XTV1_OTOGA